MSDTEYILSDELEDEAFNFSEDEAGGATEVVYTSYVSAPVIESGAIKHPYAQTALEGSSVAGVMSGRIMSSNVMAPSIENGDIVLPWAQSVSSVYGLVCGVESNSAVTAPMIIDGVITLPGSNGGITSAEFSPPNESPWVTNGVLYIPYANQYYNSSVGTPGVIDSFQIGNYYAPQIDNGCICLPYAQTSYVGSRVTGAMSGQISVSHVSAPLIENGNMILPYAQYENGSSVTGLVAGIEYNSSIEAPSISDGLIQLPSGGSSTVLGLRDMYGNAVAWEDLPTAENAIVLSTHYVGSYKYDLLAYKSDGYLGIQLVQDFDS